MEKVKIEEGQSTTKRQRVATHRQPNLHVKEGKKTSTKGLSPVVETTCIIIAATAFFFMRFHHPPVIAATLATPATVETSPENENASSEEEEEAEKIIKERLSENPNDAEFLRALMEVKIKAQKVDEAIGVINRLIEIEPEEMEWLILKANMYIYNDDHETAKKLLEEILQRYPLRVEAFHGLVMASDCCKGLKMQWNCVRNRRGFQMLETLGYWLLRLS